MTNPTTATLASEVPLAGEKERDRLTALLERLRERCAETAEQQSSDYPESARDTAEAIRAIELDVAVRQYIEQSVSPTGAPTVPTDLMQRLQQKCSDWGAYWRASDAHGVELRHDQALELLRDALGVEVEISNERECETCRGVGTIDETLGGYSFSNPAVPCPDCDGKGYWAPSPAAPTAPAGEPPLGAILNGRTYADRLEATGLGCEAGNLLTCSDWVEFRRCFEHLADWAQHLSHPSPAPAGEPGQPQQPLDHQPAHSGYGRSLPACSGGAPGVPACDQRQSQEGQ